MKWLENMTGGYSSSAKVVNDTLVLSLPDAKSPIVWRMELKEMNAAAFEIQKKDGDHILVMNMPKGETRQIAPFDSHAKALKALMSTSQAMEQAQIISKTAANDSAGKAGRVAGGKSRSGQALAGLIGIIILVGLLFMLTRIGPQKAPPFATGTSATASQAGSSTSAGTPGVPMSADDFLRQR